MTAQIDAGTYSGYYDHYSTAATVEQGLGLPCLANACTASTLPIFGNVPSPSASITLQRRASHPQAGLAARWPWPSGGHGHR